MRTLILLTSLMFFAPQAECTTFLTRPFSTSVNDAPVIVRGSIANQIYSDWVLLPEDGTKRLYTFFELKISEVLKGAAPASGNLFFRQMGGEKNGMGMMIPGSAEFKRGEEVVVFLNPRNPDGSFDLLSLMMGKYEVVKDENGESVLRGPGITEGTAIVDEHGHETGGQNGSKSVKKWTLDGLRALIKEQSQNNDGAKKMSVSPTVKPVEQNPAPLKGTPRETEAPALQQITPEASSTNGSDAGIPDFWMYVAGVVVLLLLGWYIKK